jgi:thioredoxin-like negative regulator of GroEL
MAMVPTIKRLAGKYEGRVKVAELNVGRGPKTASRLGVRGTPTVLFFNKGAVVERVVGMRGQHYFEEIIEEDLLDSVSSAEKEAS